MPGSALYGWLMLAGISVSLAVWARLARRDFRLLIVYGSALVGAFLGAKLVYLAAEGWLYWQNDDRWIILATGKSILGALLGGYASVELAKCLTEYTKPTGDLFAIVAPIGIMLGRIGCMFHGCCLGVRCETPFSMPDAAGAPRWPASQTEFCFNLFALITLFVLRRRRILPNQLFHLYLIAYGIFRFAHEFWRATPKVAGGLSGYQIASLLVIGLGMIGFERRRRQQVEFVTGNSPEAVH